MAAEDLIGTESFTKRDVTPGLDPGPILDAGSSPG